LPSSDMILRVAYFFQEFLSAGVNLCVWKAQRNHAIKLNPDAISCVNFKSGVKKFARGNSFEL
jgi:hypothetical protein